LTSQLSTTYNRKDMSQTSVKILAQNRKARFNYTVEDSIECGIVLEGTEVKSVRAGNVSYPDAFAEIKNGEVWMQNFHITPYVYSSIFNHDPDRPKKLLLHRDEIKRLIRKVDEKGFTLIPLNVYLKDSLIKIQLGICKGKKAYDKRSEIRDKDVKRDIQREFRSKNDG